jgi:hypothetical protein
MAVNVDSVLFSNTINWTLLTLGSCCQCPCLSCTFIIEGLGCLMSWHCLDMLGSKDVILRDIMRSVALMFCLRLFLALELR